MCVWGGERYQNQTVRFGPVGVMSRWLKSKAGSGGKKYPCLVGSPTNDDDDDDDDFANAARTRVTRSYVVRPAYNKYTRLHAGNPGRQRGIRRVPI